MIEAFVGLLLLTPVVIAIVFLVRLVTLSKQVKQMNERLSAVEDSLSDLSSTFKARESSPQTTKPAHDRDTKLGQKVTEEESLSKTGVLEAPPPIPVPPESQAVPADKSGQRSGQAATKPQEAKKPTKTKEDWESLIGGKWLNRIGAFAIIIAVGFFLKYAFDQEWLSETVQVSIGGFIGLALVALAWRFDTKDMRIFAQGLVGAGISILYISIYSSFNFYSLIPQLPAFALMMVVTILTFWQAFRYDSLAVSILGWAGGFLTPFLLSSDTVNEVGLFSYILLLAAGLLAITYKKEQWAILEPLTLVATYITFFVWYEEFFTSELHITALLFLTAFWALFFALGSLWTFNRNTPYFLLRQIVAGLNVILFYAPAYEIMEDFHSEWTGLATLILALPYVVVAIAAYSSEPEHRQQAMLLPSISGALLLGIASIIQLENYEVVCAISMEALLLFFLGLRLKLMHLRILGYSLLLIMLMVVFDMPDMLGVREAGQFTVLFSWRTAAYLSLVAAAGIGAMLHRKYVSEKPIAEYSLHIAWMFMFWCFISVETADYFVAQMYGASGLLKQSLSFNQLMIMSGVWMAYSLLLMWLGLRHKLLVLRIGGLITLALAFIMGAARGMFFSPLEYYDPVLNLRVFYFAVLIAGAFGHLLLFNVYQGILKKPELLRSTFSVAISLLILALLTGETIDIYRVQLESVRSIVPLDTAFESQLQNLQQLSLSLVWLVFSIGLMVYGILRKRRVLRVLAFVLFGLSILKIFIYDLSELETLYRIFSFIGLGVILLLVSYLYQRFKDMIFGQPEEDDLY
ncbi:MAG: hypothetical protein CL946_02615 [Ectothiorhodospiraceae bacterium]|nr:hypothetical protein [Ectothiorhodospiraceae bacterium]